MTVHIIGGGLAGLAAAVTCCEREMPVVLYDIAPHLGGRARSYKSADLGAIIDNGTHAVLRNNESVFWYLNRLGATDRLEAHGSEGLPFSDVADGASWTLKIPSALWSAASRPPYTSALDLLGALNLAMCNPNNTAATVLRASPAALHRLWEPLCTSALNTPLAEASPKLLLRVLKAMINPCGLRQGLFLPKHSMSDTYIAPAEDYLGARGVTIRTQSALRELILSDQRVTGLVFDETLELADSDRVILAVPPWTSALATLGIDTSAFTYAPIVNAHFRPDGVWALPNAQMFLGLTGGQGQWALIRAGVLSITVSAADNLVHLPGDEIAARLWAEIAPSLGQADALMPAHHVIKERRATLRHTPALEGLRPKTRTRFANLCLAGDWVDTGLPCTLEGAIQSGREAAKTLF